MIINNLKTLISSFIQIDVNETQQVDVPFFSVRASDMDMGINAQVVYSTSPSPFFTVDPSSGKDS